MRWRKGRACKSPARVEFTVAFASQTGRAEQIARQSARMLVQGGRTAEIRELASLTPDDIRGAGTLLVVTSTYGFGEAPDSARAFARKYLGKPAQLKGLRYAVLALGNRDYPNFCRFGRTVDEWLRASGAEPLFDRIDVDAEDAKPLEAWRGRLLSLTGQTVAESWALLSRHKWRLTARRALNPDSATPAYHLAFAPVETPAPGWTAGDIAVITPCHSTRETDAFLETHDLKGGPRGGVERPGDGSAGGADLQRMAEQPLPRGWPGNDEDLAQSLRPLSPPRIFHRQYRRRQMAGIAGAPPDPAQRQIEHRLGISDRGS